MKPSQNILQLSKLSDPLLKWMVVCLKIILPFWKYTTPSGAELFVKTSEWSLMLLLSPSITAPWCFASFEMKLLLSMAESLYKSFKMKTPPELSALFLEKVLCVTMMPTPYIAPTPPILSALLDVKLQVSIIIKMVKPDASITPPTLAELYSNVLLFIDTLHVEVESTPPSQRT